MVAVLSYGSLTESASVCMLSRKHCPSRSGCLRTFVQYNKQAMAMQSKGLWISTRHGGRHAAQQLTNLCGHRLCCMWLDILWHSIMDQLPELLKDTARKSGTPIPWKGFRIGRVSQSKPYPLKSTWFQQVCMWSCWWWQSDGNNVTFHSVRVSLAWIKSLTVVRRKETCECSISLS
jgi:hypothetical protein